MRLIGRNRSSTKICSGGWEPSSGSIYLIQIHLMVLLCRSNECGCSQIFSWSSPLRCPCTTTCSVVTHTLRGQTSRTPTRARCAQLCRSLHAADSDSSQHLLSRKFRFMSQETLCRWGSSALVSWVNVSMCITPYLSCASAQCTGEPTWLLQVPLHCKVSPADPAASNVG